MRRVSICSGCWRVCSFDCDELYDKHKYSMSSPLTLVLLAATRSDVRSLQKALHGEGKGEDHNSLAEFALALVRLLMAPHVLPLG